MQFVFNKRTLQLKPRLKRKCHSIENSTQKKKK